jgi:Predicted spermidine synthase with an N-terminal membrane domain
MNPETLLKAYSEHAAEYRMEVAMGWDRMKFFLTLNVALFAALSGFGGRGPVAASGYLAGALASLLGAHVVLKTHRYYVNAREAFKAIETELGLDGRFSMATTPGMVGAPWLHSLKITTAGVIVLGVFVVLDIALAVYAL